MGYPVGNNFQYGKDFTNDQNASVTLSRIMLEESM